MSEIEILPAITSRKAKKSSLSVCTTQSGSSNNNSKMAVYPPDLPYIDPSKEIPPHLGHDLRKKLLCSNSTFSIILYLDDIAAKYELKDCECLHLATSSMLRLLDIEGVLSSPQDILKSRVRLLEHYMCGGIESEMAVLDQMSCFCNDTRQKESLGTLVQSLYGLSLLTEQGILAWAKLNRSAICSCCPGFANWLNQLQLTMTNDSQIICSECSEHHVLDHLQSHHHHNHHNQHFFNPDALSSGDTLLDGESSASLNLSALSVSSQCSTVKPEEEEVVVGVEEEEEEFAEEEEEEENETLSSRSVQFSSLLYMRDTIIEEIIIVSDQTQEDSEQDDEILYHEETFDYLAIMPTLNRIERNA